MDFLRSLLNWVRKHTFLSFSLAALALAAAVVTRVLLDRFEGTLSAPLERGTIVESVYGIGTVMATKSFQVKPGVANTIVDLYVNEGDRKNRGDLLINLSGSVFRAPFPGVVTSLPFKIGENIFANTVALTYVDLADRYIVVTMEQQGALRVRRGQKAKLSFDSMRQQNYDGIVVAVYSFAGNFLARINVDKLPPEVLPDMTADVAIEIRRHDDALLVPVAALEGGQMRVRRGKDVPYFTSVELGIVDGAVAEVTAGDLRAGDSVFIRKKP